MLPADSARLEKSFFSTSPMERHGDSDEGRKAAAHEADRMLREYFDLLRRPDLDLWEL